MKFYELSAAISESVNYLAVPFVTFGIVCLRSMYYGGKRWYTILTEAFLFAIISRVLLPVAVDFYVTFLKISEIKAFDYAFLTCITIGFIGIETLSDKLKRFINESKK